MKKLRTIIEIVANNRNNRYKQFTIVKIRIRLFASNAMLSSKFFSIDELTHVLLIYYNFLYHKDTQLNFNAFLNYFDSFEAYAETGDATLRDLLLSDLDLNSFEIEFILSNPNKSINNIDTLMNLLKADARNSKYSFNANIYLTFNDVSKLENDSPIQDINKEEIENFIIFRSLDRSAHSPIAQEDYLLEQLENLYPSRPYNRKRKITKPSITSNASNTPTTSRQAALRDIEISRAEDLLEKELEDDDDPNKLKRGKGIINKSRLLDDILSKYCS